jgi:HEAT repeat protein
MYDKNSKSIYNFTELVICNLSLYVDLGNYMVLWLGESDNKNSLNFLLDLYNKSNKGFSKRELIQGIGIHIDQPATTSFLKEIIYSKAEKDLRKSAVLWLGFQGNNEAFTELKKIIKNDSSIETRKDAVISLSNMQSPDAIDELINIAKHNGNDELRKHAVYGLGNKAVKQAEEILKNIIEDDPDIEIKKHAVYALVNSSNNIIPYLIKIAKTHPSLSIRKSAIWSLGNSDDERAVDALIDMAKNN